MHLSIPCNRWPTSIQGNRVLILNEQNPMISEGLARPEVYHNTPGG